MLNIYWLPQKAAPSVTINGFMCMKMNIKEIKLFVMDVDGTLTDGKIYITDDGEFMKAFHVKDGYGIQKLKENNIIPIVITGRQSEIVNRRCKELGIAELYQGIYDKKETMENILQKYQLTFKNAVYVGDDVNDLECMQMCGVSACPADAIPAVQQVVTYRSAYKGGEGAVRDIIEWILNT